jgi:hypothetical protein
VARRKKDDWLVSAILFWGAVTFFLGKAALDGEVAPARPRSVKPA